MLQVGHGENQYYHEILEHLLEIQEVGKALSHLVLCLRGCSPAEKTAALQSKVAAGSLPAFPCLYGKSAAISPVAAVAHAVPDCP